MWYVIVLLINFLDISFETPQVCASKEEKIFSEKKFLKDFDSRKLKLSWTNLMKFEPWGHSASKHWNSLELPMKENFLN